MRLFLIVVLFIYALTAYGQRKKAENPTTPPPPTGIAAKTSGMARHDGFFTFFYDDKQDKVHLLVDKVDIEFLYVESLTAGIGSNDIGLDRNQLGRERIVRFERRGNKLLLVEPNYFFRAVSNHEAERKAVEESFAQSVLWGFTVSAQEEGKLLVDATDFFLQDVHDVTGRLRSLQQGSYSLDKSRSAFYLPRTKNFPLNTEWEVTLTFTGQATGEFIRSVTPTPSAVTVREHFSFIQLPDSGYEPRAFDPRAGYFSTSYYDYATPIAEPIEKRFITRHRLKKKDPAAAVSEPVKPIVYYMDPGAPEPIRSALMEGAQWWNKAFEAAGYKDAFQVKVLPEGADPMDVRYNIINWVHRSTRGWSYGGGITDPRSGEILKGHVVLGSLRVRQDFLIAEGLLAPYETGKPVSKEMEQMALNRLKQLAAHEVGHTLGLAHAYSSSSEGRSSVMDYPHPLVRLNAGKIDLSEAYDNKIGEFDKVSITYGYQDFPAGTDVPNALNTIIQNSLKAGMTFLSDQDARPAGSAHPFTHLWDNGQSAHQELNRVLDVRAMALKQFGERNIPEGRPMAMLEEVLVPLFFFHRYQTEAAAKVVGGLNYRYALRGDGQAVTQFVPAADQRQALDALLRTVQPETLILPESTLRLIPPRPLGYERSREVVKIRTELTFDPFSAAESAADMTFSLLFHPARANRLWEYHARESALPSFTEVVEKSMTSTILGNTPSGYAGAVQMTVNHSALTHLMRLARHREASAQVKAMVQYQLSRLQEKLSLRTKTATGDWAAHYQFLLSQIETFQDDPAEFEAPVLLTAPPGQPIGSLDGCGWH
ncbi:MAG: zinc-dependent metalloprotease [Cyclobacteriaceae bacterium]